MVFSTRPRKRPSDPEGQAAVELALVLPLLAIFTVVIAQFTLVARDQLALWQSARDISRRVAVASDPYAEARQHRSPQTSIDITDGAVTVDISRRTSLTFAGFGFLRRSVTLNAQVSMALEPQVAFSSDAGGDNFDARGP
jgi:Flp pilus assembly protein TadG